LHAKRKSKGHELIAFDITKPSVSVDEYIQVDLSDPAAIVDAVSAMQGTFDALINNAGLPPREGLGRKVLEVNYLGLRDMTNTMASRLNAGGAIVHTASRAGAFWRDNLAQIKALRGCTWGDIDAFIQSHKIDDTRAYNLSKEAVIVDTIATTEAFLAQGIRVNCVSPAAVSTGILDDFTKAFGPKVAKNIARAGRPGHPSEIADVILFLASPQSAWIKGQDITIDGGMSAMGMTDMMELKG
jgi:NAD(P)-dependent dehydrogenase (short-subunit alcohol dehydrogenase family)